MRCKKHPIDLSSCGGVCASCLRERLFALIVAQAQAQVQIQQSLEDRRKSDVHPPPLVFPRSVSPYITRRISVTEDWAHHHDQRPGHPVQRFYSTPQVGPSGSIVPPPVSHVKNSKKLSLISTLFRSKAEKLDSYPGVSALELDCVDRSMASSSSPSRFSGILFGRRKKQTRTFSLDESITGVTRRPCRDRCRGMSPARRSSSDELYDGSSGYSSESSQGWRQTPSRAVTRARRGRTGHALNVSGLTFCLNPLVRASPSRHRKQKGAPQEMSISCDTRVPAKPGQSTSASFCKNRSRKLADFGRLSHNHC